MCAARARLHVFVGQLGEHFAKLLGAALELRAHHGLDKHRHVELELGLGARGVVVDRLQVDNQAEVDIVGSTFWATTSLTGPMGDSMVMASASKVTFFRFSLASSARLSTLASIVFVNDDGSLSLLYTVAMSHAMSCGSLL